MGTFVPVLQRWFECKQHRRDAFIDVVTWKAVKSSKDIVQPWRGKTWLYGTAGCLAHESKSRTLHGRR